MGTPKKSGPIGAAECAQRTGLTVRALRVYERHGLIHPTRSAKGWRRYGPKELAQLNVVLTLKTFGLTLEQIRSVLASSPPPLAHVLRLQLEAWRTRKAMVEKGLGLVQAALARIESGNRLSVDELCTLARTMDMNNHQVNTRELINKAITPEEERAYMTWWAARPPNEAMAMRDYGAAMRILFRELQSFMEKKVDPAATGVQTLVDQWNEIALRYGLRSTMVALLEWNTSIARKWLDVGEHSLSQGVSSGKVVPNGGLWGYFRAAVEASGWHQGLMRIVDEAATLVDKTTGPSSAPAKALARRLAQICADHSLGDPAVYARWSAAMQRGDKSADVEARRKAAWGFLASAASQSVSPSHRKK
jgi:MerR family transcriptional regulator, thiopeptide resistance regulator